VVDRITNNAGPEPDLRGARRHRVALRRGVPQVDPAGAQAEGPRIRGRQAVRASTFEGCVVRVADKIAYLGRDIGRRGRGRAHHAEGHAEGPEAQPGPHERPDHRHAGARHRQGLGGKDRIVFSDDRYAMLCRLKDFNYSRIYNHPRLIESDRIIRRLLTEIHGHLLDCRQRFGKDARAYAASGHRCVRHFGQFFCSRGDLYGAAGKPDRSVVDFIAA